MSLTPAPVQGESKQCELLAKERRTSEGGLLNRKRAQRGGGGGLGGETRQWDPLSMSTSPYSPLSLRGFGLRPVLALGAEQSTHYFACPPLCVCTRGVY